MAELRQLRCLRCGSDDLTLTQTYAEHVTVGPLLVDGAGAIRTRDAGTKAAGDLIRTRIACHKCWREWTPRRSFDPCNPEEQA